MYGIYAYTQHIVIVSFFTKKYIFKCEKNLENYY